MQTRYRLVWQVGLVLGLSASTAAWAQQERGSDKEVPAAASEPVALSLAPAGESGQVGTGRLELEPKELNFGEVWVGMPARGEFTVKNVGDGPLTVTVRNTCGCMVVASPKESLAPGESDQFTIAYGTTRAGAANQRVTVLTNDPDTPTVEIPVRGTVKTVYDFSPADRVRFQAAAADAVETQVLTLKNNYKRPLRLQLKNEENIEPFEAELREIKAGEQYQLVVRTKPPLSFGSSSATIILDTDAADLPALKVPVTAVVQPRVSVTPARVYIDGAADQPSSRTVRLRYQLDDPTKITEIQVSHDWIVYEQLPDVPPRPGQDYSFHSIRLMLPAGAEIPDEGGMLTILTDDRSPGFQKFEVPIAKRVVQARSESDSPAKPPKAGEGVERDRIRQMIEDAMARAQAKRAADEAAGAATEEQKPPTESKPRQEDRGD
jgi:hypothetical protein